MQDYSIKSSQNVPLISIIIVTLNAEKYIENTINSILNQDFNSYEIIVIDGQSKDSTLNVLIPFKKRIEKIITEKDEGIYDAMNKGIKNSCGDWLIYLNAGDIFFNNHVLSNVSDSLQINNFDIIYGDYALYSNDVIEQSSKINKFYFFSHTICHQSAFIKRTVFKQIGNHDLSYKIISDRDFFTRAYTEKLKFSKINVIICFWDSVGFSSKNHKLYINEVTRFRKLNFSIFDMVTILFKKAIKKL